VGPQAPIWIIGADHWPRAYLRAELIERGCEAVGFVSARGAVLELLAARSRPPSLIVCDLQGQHLSPGLAAALFRAEVPVIAIAGASEAEDQMLRAFPWAAFLRRPVTVGSVADTAVRLAGPAASGPPAEGAPGPGAGS
jgi:hypothetical protein